MDFRYKLLGAIVCATLATGPAKAENANKPAMEVGDRWSWQHVNAVVNEQDFTKIEDVVEVSDSGYRTRVRRKGTNGYALVSYTPELNPTDNGVERYQNALQRFTFPLAVGHKWSGEFDKYLLNSGKHGKFRLKSEVTAFETVTVPAGTFEAFKITTSYEGTATDDDANSGQTTEVHWYVPAIKNDVKSESTFVKDGAVRSKDRWELLDYSLR